jgi:hypothetical protein
MIGQSKTPVKAVAHPPDSSRSRQKTPTYAEQTNAKSQSNTCANSTHKPLQPSQQSGGQLSQRHAGPQTAQKAALKVPVPNFSNDAVRKLQKSTTKKNDLGNKSTRLESGSNGGSNDQSSTEDIPEKVGPHSFKVYTRLGKGSFGEVYLVEKIDDKKIYAMKVLYKHNILSKFYFFI